MIVIGGSLGGMQAVQSILSTLPADFVLPIVVALHRPPDDEDLLTPLLQKGCALRVSEAIDKDPIERGRVYVAPADYHVLIERYYLSLSVDERVNYARPSIDVLFESAAFACSDLAIAVVLTGAGSDGAKGAAVIESRGGKVLIEDPATAYRGDLPAAAKAATKAPIVISLLDIALALRELGKRKLQEVAHAS